MVMDLQDVQATIEDNIARSQIRLLGSSTTPIVIPNEQVGDEHEDEDADRDKVEDEEPSKTEDDASQRVDESQGECVGWLLHARLSCPYRRFGS